MADFDYISFFTYNPAGVSQGGFDFPGTATDGESMGAGSGTFEIGDTWNNADYVGQLTFDGELVPVFESNNSGDFFVISTRPIADVTAPSSLTLPPINDGPFTVCFSAGTLICTPEGERKVEHLNIGDLVVTCSGDRAPVKWIGRQTLHRFLGARAQLVRIDADALGQGLPHSDLTVTADHAMVVDGLLINASALVNGTTISFVPMEELADQFIVYHVETEEQDIIIANGAPTETFVDAVSRRNFDNYDDYLALYGADRIVPEVNLPRISSQRMLPQFLKSKLGLETPVLEKIGCMVG